MKTKTQSKTDKKADAFVRYDMPATMPPKRKEKEGDKDDDDDDGGGGGDDGGHGDGDEDYADGQIGRRTLVLE